MVRFGWLKNKENVSKIQQKRHIKTGKEGIGEEEKPTMKNKKRREKTFNLIILFSLHKLQLFTISPLSTSLSFFVRYLIYIQVKEGNEDGMEWKKNGTIASSEWMNIKLPSANISSHFHVNFPEFSFLLTLPDYFWGVDTSQMGYERQMYTVNSVILTQNTCHTVKCPVLGTLPLCWL